jgi:CHAT domain-containing protein
MEVAEMDLSRVEVVVLSACETGLGQVAGGEGVLGIQRAFQLAGANTVITSLWTVDDLATQLLMVHFYDQLWQPGKTGVGKLEAFRQSQLMLLHEGPKRGFMSEEEQKPKQPARTPPFYWAAFSISGDWR